MHTMHAQVCMNINLIGCISINIADPTWLAASQLCKVGDGIDCWIQGRQRPHSIGHQKLSLKLTDSPTCRGFIINLCKYMGVRGWWSGPKLQEARGKGGAYIGTPRQEKEGSVGWTSMFIGVHFFTHLQVSGVWMVDGTGQTFLNPKQSTK